MNAILVFLALIISTAILVVAPADGASALVVCAVVAAVAGLFISRTEGHKKLLMQLFLGGLLVRMLVGTGIYVLHLQDFFGGDAITYDFFGYALLKGWQGEQYYQSQANLFIGQTGSSAWGMLYLIAALYGMIGRNMLATQFVNAVLGAATAPIIFLCTQHIFNNNKAAKFAGIFAAFYPSLVLWSSQGLKDAAIIFLLSLSILATLKLGEKFTLKHFLALVFSLLGLLSLRFYIFYMMVAAVSGSFIIGMRPATAQNLVRQLTILVVIGISLTYFGVVRYTGLQAESFGNLETLQRTRLDQSRSAESGFGSDVDVSTTTGALSVLPTGLVYLLLAPFPWQVTSLRQTITLPEMIVWWTSFPLLVLGLWFAIKYRFRQVLPILIFSSMLTLAYSIFQGNVGTAYRQRSQLLVFYFIFVSVGIVLLLEKREEHRQAELAARRALADTQAATVAARRANSPLTS